jgi:hypothetical protein
MIISSRKVHLPFVVFSLPANRYVPRDQAPSRIRWAGNSSSPEDLFAMHDVRAGALQAQVQKQRKASVG